MRKPGEGRGGGCLVSNLRPTLRPHGLQPAMLLCLWDFPGKNTEVGCYFLLHGSFLTQGSKPMSPVLADRFFTTEPPGKPGEVGRGQIGRASY